MATNSIEDVELPKAIVTRIIKQALPEGVLIQKDARLAICKASTVFINYIASTANDVSKEDNHKTVTAEHIFASFKAMDVDQAAFQDLQSIFDAYREAQKQKRNNQRAKAAAKATGKDPNMNEEAEGMKDKEEGAEVDELEEDDDIAAAEDEDTDQPVIPQKRDAPFIIDETENYKVHRPDPVHMQTEE